MKQMKEYIQLSYKYLYGIKVEKDIEKAKEYCEKATVNEFIQKVFDFGEHEIKDKQIIQLAQYFKDLNDYNCKSALYNLIYIYLFSEDYCSYWGGDNYYFIEKYHQDLDLGKMYNRGEYPLDGNLLIQGIHKNFNQKMFFVLEDFVEDLYELSKYSLPEAYDAAKLLLICHENKLFDFEIDKDYLEHAQQKISCNPAKYENFKIQKINKECLNMGREDLQLAIQYLKANSRTTLEHRQNQESAVHHFLKVAEVGNVWGQIGLMYCYSIGKGVDMDYSKARQYCDQALENGFIDAYYMTKTHEDLRKYSSILDGAFLRIASVDCMSAYYCLGHMLDSYPYFKICEDNNYLDANVHAKWLYPSYKKQVSERVESFVEQIEYRLEYLKDTFDNSPSNKILEICKQNNFFQSKHK